MGKSKKINWKQLGEFWEGHFHITAEEAGEIIAGSLMHNGWLGTPTKLGRMWQQDNSIESFTILLTAIENFEKTRKLKFITAIEVMFEEKHLDISMFCASCHIPYWNMKPARFRNLVSQWRKQLQDKGVLFKKVSAFTTKRLKEAAARSEKKLRLARLTKK